MRMGCKSVKIGVKTEEHAEVGQNAYAILVEHKFFKEKMHRFKLKEKQSRVGSGAQTYY